MGKRQKLQRRREGWQPFVLVPLDTYLTEEATPETREYLQRSLRGATVIANNLFVCVVRPVQTQLGDVKVLFETCIRRRDRQPVRDWRDTQRIKNELFGHGAEAVELYPAESRLVDHCNVTFLYVMPAIANTDGQPLVDHLNQPLYYRWPFGFPYRLVSEKPFGRGKQRPFPREDRPRDLQDVTLERLHSYERAIQAALDPHPAVTQIQNQPLPADAFLRNALADSLPQLKASLGETRLAEIFAQTEELVNQRREVMAQEATPERQKESEELALKIEERLGQLEQAMQTVTQNDPRQSVSRPGTENSYEPPPARR